MRFKTNRRAVSLTLVLLVSFVVSGFLFSPVHAAAPALVQSVATAGLVDMASSSVAWGSTVSTGDLIMVHTFCMVGGNPSTVSDGQGSIFTVIPVGGRGEVWYGFAKSGSTTITVSGGSCTFSSSPGGAFSAEEFSGVGSIGNNLNNNPGTSTACGSNCIQTLSISITVNNALIYETLDIYGGGLGSCPTITNGSSSQITTQTLSCLNGLAGAFSVGRTTYAPNRGIGVNTLSMQASAWTQVGHELVELDPPGGAPSNLGTQTACFGNCGNPAVTLINTNSTHTVPFNQSQTIFYQFQSQLNGQVLNITTNVAKTYNNGNVLTIGIYTVPACSPGLPAFTAACPAVLQKSVSVTNPSKGFNTLGTANVPVSAGQWVGFALTASLTGMDVNDTNADVTLYQTGSSGGTQGLTSTISQSSQLDPTSDVGLWGYVQGNTVTGTLPPPTTSNGSCAGLDCILTNAVNGFCNVVSQACQTGVSMLLVIVLTIISIMVIVFMFNQIVPNINLGRVGLGELGILIFIMWVAIFTGFGLMSLYVIVTIFLAISIMFIKKVNPAGI